MTKCIILAGGFGLRLGRLTAVVNKHLLPVRGEPMIIHSLRYALTAGCRDVLIVTTPQAVGQFAGLMAYGGEPIDELESLYYVCQRQPKGIADAIRHGRSFAGDDWVLVLLGDNLFAEPEQFSRVVPERSNGAVCWLKDVEHPEQYGIAEFTDGGHVARIVEKPLKPPSNMAAVGAYLLDTTCWKRIDALVPSARGEMEVVDLLNSYAADGQLTAVPLQGKWTDIGVSVPDYEKVALHGA